MKYSCPCCGYLTMSKKPPGTYDICPICCWEDSYADAPSERSNQVSLRQGQLNYVEFGACEEAFVNEARRPAKGEPRVPDWEPLALKESREQREVIELINRAFDGVPRGVSLHEADVIDNYGSGEERRNARALDTESCWQEVPDADIARFDWILPFLDDDGYRYYLPAYMTWTIKQRNDCESASGGSTINSLTLSDADDIRTWQLSRFRYLDDAQSHAVYRFLKHVVDHDVACCGSYAKEAIRRYWNAFAEGPEKQDSKSEI